ncbi:hypothetical protein NHX12_017325 [Muraenolepis orangiensis]|uniref:Uncharacterized protein n=1 Tax=Muraenolepis orangiensis TaxID=630683 RepID=A0A9Q0D4S7_9TELE|nr:hypothetical protein NHX12_017325 [Muraenolepis orangiensis]
MPTRNAEGSVRAPGKQGHRDPRPLTVPSRPPATQHRDQRIEEAQSPRTGRERGPRDSGRGEKLKPNRAPSNERREARDQSQERRAADASCNRDAERGERPRDTERSANARQAHARPRDASRAARASGPE